jgi:hypothetical protein
MNAAARTRHDQLQASLAYLDALAAAPRRVPLTCEGCRYFVPDPINPPAGLGDCSNGRGMHYPSQPHHCIYRKETTA